VRGAVYFVAAALVALSALWAYRVNYAAQGAMDRVAALRSEIARQREALGILRADWAYLNAPERLARLAAEHREALKLEPLAARHFLDLADLPRPPPESFWVRADPGLLPKEPDPKPAPASARLGAGAAPRVLR
jgi:hypothetical protein